MLDLPVLAWLRSCASHLLNGILAAPGGCATAAWICREGDGGHYSWAKAKVFPVVSFSSRTHTQMTIRSVFSQGHHSVLEEKLRLEVAISCSHGVPIISVPRLLWVTDRFPMKAGWCSSDWTAEVASAAGEQHTSSLICGGLGWEHQLHFLVSELLWGK